MAENILPKDLYTLKLTKTDTENLVRFCMISAPIFDAVSSVLKQIKAIEPYVKEWQELERPVSNIIRNIKKGSN